jgi:hypothetical protein
VLLLHTRLGCNSKKLSGFPVMTAEAHCLISPSVSVDELNGTACEKGDTVGSVRACSMSGGFLDRLEDHEWCEDALSPSSNTKYSPQVLHGAKYPNASRIT